MKKYSYVLMNIDPLTFAEKSGDQVLYTTKQYVPGSAVRGALAAEFINKNKLENAHENADFFNLFLSGKVRFLPAYPIGGCDMLAAQPIVLPLSLMRSKDGTQTVDLSGINNYAPGFKKLYGYAVRNSKTLKKVTTRVQTEFHMSRASATERISGKSIDGNIFNYEYIKPGQYFKGCCLVDDELAAVWEKAMRGTENIYLGRSRSSQYGKCILKLEEEKEKAEAFYQNDRLYLCALTPYIPYCNEQSIEKIAEELLTDLEKNLKNDVEFSRKDLQAFANIEQLDGYVGVWSAKKQRERALSAGSLLQMKVEKGKLDAFKLSKALQKGLGKNCIDGFGQFFVWEPLQENITEYEETVYKPELHNDVKQKARLVVKELISQRIRQQAAKKASSDNMDMGEDYKNVCKRVEALLRKYSLDIVRDEIRYNFRGAAKERLNKIKFCGNSIYDILLEKDGYKKLGLDIKWDNPLALEAEQVTAMRRDLGEDIFALDEAAMKEFWLWFMRHAVK